jgi:hypothetical protein
MKRLRRLWQDWIKTASLANRMLMPTSRTRQITLAAVFASVYFVLRSIPTFEMVGLSSRFTAGDFMLPAIALLAGPWAGIVSVIIGTVLAYAVRPPVFFGLDFLPGTVEVMILGFILSNKRQAARAVYVIILVTFLLSPYSLLFGYAQVPYTWLHILALIILISPLVSKMSVWLMRPGLSQVLSIALLAFVGTMGQHLTGGLLYEIAAGYVGGIDPHAFQQFWRIIFWLYPIERFVIVAISTFVTVALYRALKLTHF